jgi:hypothetical protein
VILDESLHGTLKDGAELKAFDAGGLTEFILEVPCDTADAGHREATAVIRSDMT